LARGKEEESGIFQSPLDRTRKLSHTDNSRQHGGCPTFATSPAALSPPRAAASPSLSTPYIFLFSLFQFLFSVFRQRRTELAGGAGAQAGGEFAGVQVALAVEAAEKIVGGLFSFLRVAFYATRDQVAVGIAPKRACGTTWSRHCTVDVVRRKQ
jgi:hypothetical protein